MKVYISLFKMKLISALQYRAAALAGICTQLFFGLVFIMVYITFYESNDTSYPMQVNHLVNYLWLNQAFFALVYIWAKDKDFLSMIKNGNVAYELCRPINFYSKWYITMYATRIANVTLRFLPVILIAFLLPRPYNMTLPPTFMTFIVFIISLIISSILVTSITMFYHLITFFTLDEKGIISFLMVFGEIFSGGTVPIVFFPKFMQVVAKLLPFQYICDLPFRIYSGNILLNESIFALMGGLIWSVIIIFLGYLLSRKALRSASVQGG